MHPGRTLGALMGFVTFFTAFFLPFAGETGKQWLVLTTTRSLYGVSMSTIEGLLTARVVGIGALVDLVGAAVIITGGTVGVYPRIGGALGVAGMLAETLGQYMLLPSLWLLVALGPAYWLLWATSAVTVGAALWVWRDERRLKEKPSAKGWSR